MEGIPHQNSPVLAHSESSPHPYKKAPREKKQTGVDLMMRHVEIHKTHAPKSRYPQSRELSTFGINNPSITIHRKPLGENKKVLNRRKYAYLDKHFTEDLNESFLQYLFQHKEISTITPEMQQQLNQILIAKIMICEAEKERQTMSIESEKSVEKRNHAIYEVSRQLSIGKNSIEKRPIVFRTLKTTSDIAGTLTYYAVPTALLSNAYYMYRDLCELYANIKLKINISRTIRTLKEEDQRKHNAYIQKLISSDPYPYLSRKYTARGEKRETSREESFVGCSKIEDLIKNNRHRETKIKEELVEQETAIEMDEGSMTGKEGELEEAEILDTVILTDKEIYAALEGIANNQNIFRKINSLMTHWVAIAGSIYTTYLFFSKCIFRKREQFRSRY